MNVSSLEVPPFQQVQRVSAEASDKDADFLSLRLLNKRSRVRLSPEPLDLQPIPGKGQLFSVANSKGWFAAAVRNASSDISLIFSPLADLRAAFSAATPDNAETVFMPQRSLSFAPATPNIIAFASADTRLIVGLTQGPILVFDAARFFSAGSDEIPSLHSFSSTTSSPPRQILPNPDDMPDLIAVLRDGNGSPGVQLVEILDVQKLECIGGWRSGNAPDATPTSLSWSPKGKQIAVGLQSGDIITFSPTETGAPKFVYGKPPSASNNSIIATTWLSNPTIHTIYAPPGPLNPDSEQTHIIMSLDTKNNKASDIKLNTPYYPSPGLRAPGSFMVVLRNWEPTRFILFVGDSTSSDIGVIGSVSDDAWYNYSLEETSTPSLPLDKDMNDTVLVALELDLTSTESYQHISAGEPSELPAPPIMYAYASDGTVLGWYVVNSQGQAYPGMITSQARLSVPAMTSSVSLNDMHMASAPITPVTGPVSAFGQTAFGQSSFGQSAPSASAFGSTLTPSVFGQKSAFGQTSQSSSGFGQQQQATAFGQGSTPSPFGQPSSASSFGSAAPSGGFGAFASAAPAKFGQTGFGFGTASTTGPTTTSPKPASPAPIEESMADDAPSFGGMSLGGSSDSVNKPASAFGSGSDMFGQTTLASTTSSEDKSNSFGGGFGSIKPATGFGAFSNLTSQPGAFGTTTKDAAEAPKPASAFGKPGFEANPSGGFGQSSFGQSSFGQPGFGQTSKSVFGQTGFGSTSTSTAQPVNGGFGAFASSPSSFSSAASQNGGDSKESISGGFGAFAQAGPSAFSSVAPQPAGGKPVWASSGGASQSAEETKSAFGGGNVFGGTTGQRSSFGGGNGGSFSGSSGPPAFGKAEEEPKDVDIPPTPRPAPPTVTPASPVSSPESSPQARAVPNAFSSIGNNDALSSAFTSSVPPPTSGAFGQLKTSSTGFFKPADGFGAFGSVINKDSPFYNPPKEVATKPVSVFAASTTPANTPPKSTPVSSVFGSPSVLGSSKPTFGSPSALGSNKSPFGSTSTSLTPTTPEPSSGGFASFSNKTGFGTFAGAKTASFGDLLRGGEEARDPSKPSTSVFGTPDGRASTPILNSLRSSPSINQETQADAEAESTSPAPTIPDKGKSKRSPSPTLTADDSDATVVRMGSVKILGTSPERKDGTSSDSNRPATEKENGDPMTSLTSSQTSSFVEVTAPDGDEDRDGIPDITNDSGSDLEDDNQSFLSESFSSEESPDVSDENEEEQEEKDGEGEASISRPVTPEVSKTAEPKVPLPSTSETQPRSPSTTPKLERPSLTVTEAAALPVTPSTLFFGPTPTKPIQADSTTPPGSPEPEVPLENQTKAQTPTPAISAPSPFGLGLGRPSTRPTRSSPLANAPLSPAGEEISTKAAASKSEPSLVPKAASPKLPFGQAVTDPAQNVSAPKPKPSEIFQATRPQTAPPLLFARDGPATVTNPASPLNFLVKVPDKKPSSVPLVTSSAPSFFGKPNTPSAPVPPSGNIFGNVSPKLPAAPVPNFFGRSTTTSPTPAPNFFGGKLSPSPSPSPAIPLNQKAAESKFFAGQSSPVLPPPSSPVAAETQGQGMQAQCALLFNHLNKELDQLRQYAERAKSNRVALSKPSGLSHHKDNLADAANWTLGDVPTWGQVLKTLQSDMEHLYENRRTISQTLRQLESSMLRAGTKKEEIVRFNKAKSDPEFGKMLKVRTLGPEHMETQSQLRRDIRAMRDRVQKLEDHLAASKKKLDQMKRGKPGLRAPSLDTINRTYRNIDIAVEHQAEQVVLLTSRLKKLKTTQMASRSSPRDRRLPDPRRPYNTAPSVVNAANALNGELSAQRLKRALLSARQQPLLNTKAATAPAAPVAFTTPQKPVVKGEDKVPSLGFGFDSFSESSQPWNPASFGEPSQEAGPRRRMMGSNGSRHGPSPKLKKLPAGTSSPAGAAPAPSFDWGPLPIIAPSKTLPFGFNKSPATPPPSN